MGKVNIFLISTFRFILIILIKLARTAFAQYFIFPAFLIIAHNDFRQQFAKKLYLYYRLVKNYKTSRKNAIYMC